MTFSHRIIRDFDHLEPKDLSDLKLSWNLLAKRNGNPLLAFDWCYACYSTIHREDDAHVVVISDNDEVVAIAPLVRIRYPGRSRLEIVGTTALFEPSGFLASSRDALAFLLEIVLRSRLPLCLFRIEEQDPIHAVIRDFGRRRFIALSRPPAPAAFLDLACTWDDLLAQLSSNRRYDLRRKLKRAEKMGAVELTEHVPNVDELTRFLDIAMDIEHDSWKGEAGSSLRANHRLQDFFRQYLTLYCEKRKVRFYFLAVGDSVTAMQITIESNGSCWILKQGFRNSFARMSPGILLSHMAIRSCLERGLSRYEFLGSEENWQSTWPIQHRHYQTILTIPYSIAGAMELLAAVSSRFRTK